MNLLVADLNYSPSVYYNGRSFWLLIVLVLMAYLISPLNPMSRKEREGLVTIYPAIIFVYWFLFQIRLISLEPHVHYYLAPWGVEAWMTNSILCEAFGAVFCVIILCRPGVGRRLYGSLFLVLYLLLIGNTVVSQPAVMTL